MSLPVRVQLSRRKGFNLQEHSRSINGLDAVKVDRTTNFGNPFIAGADGDAEYCVKLFLWLLSGFAVLDKGPSVAKQRDAADFFRSGGMRVLAGKNLACWCKIGSPCHADILLEIANKPVCEEVK